MLWNSINSEELRYPSWKLVSKNRKQWMKTPIEIDTSLGWNHKYILHTIKWKK